MTQLRTVTVEAGNQITVTYGGPMGSPGTDGRTILNGAVNPTTEGNNGDFYINTATNTLFGPKATGSWPTGVSLVGAAGSNGYSVLNGIVDPTSQGNNGDFYINTANNKLFGPKAGGTWPSGISLVGPAGSNGSNGTDGKTMLSGAVDPTTEGNNGDFYINTATNKLFGPKAGGTWPTGVSLVGPAGSMMNWHGVYSAGHTYATGDGVVSSEGRGFISLVDSNLNHAPPSYPTTLNSYWQLFAEKGTDGAGSGDVSGPASTTENKLPQWDSTLKKLKDGITLVTTIGSPGSDTSAPTEQATREEFTSLGVTNGNSHDHNGGDGAQIAYSSLGSIPSTFAPSAHASGHQSGGSDAIKIDDLAAGDDNTDLNASTTKHGLCPKGGNEGKFLRDDITWQAVAGVSFWSDMPGTPTRVSDTQFTITDTSNANLYDKIFTKGTIIKWLESTTFQTAMIKDATYGTNTVTINIVGNSLTAGFTSMKYCIHRAKSEVFIVPGTLPGNTATTDIAKTVYMECDSIIFGAQVSYKTGPTSTKGVWDINDDGSTIFSTKPELAAGSTRGSEQASSTLSGNTVTVVAKDSLITLDYDSGHASTPGSDAYVQFWYMPEAWRYQ